MPDVPPHQDILGLARASNVYSTHTICRIQKFAEVLKHFLRTEAEGLVQARLDEPLALIYRSDATLLVCRHTLRGQWQEFKVLRRGRSSQDWLIERIFIIDSRGDRRCVISDPKPLHDKTCWTHYDAQENSFPLLREQGHTGVCISHPMWDRGVKSACERHQRQRHAAFKLAHSTGHDEGDSLLLHLTSWDTYVVCIAHDTHNVLKWSIFSFVHDREVMHSSWIVLGSLKSSYDLLVSHMGGWMTEVIAFKDHENPGDLARFWQLMGLTDHWSAMMVKAQITWDSGQLLLAEALKDDKGVSNLVGARLMHVWQFKSFSDSRWSGLSSRCRSLIASL